MKLKPMADNVLLKQNERPKETTYPASSWPPPIKRSPPSTRWYP